MQNVDIYRHKEKERKIEHYIDYWRYEKGYKVISRYLIIENRKEQYIEELPGFINKVKRLFSGRKGSESVICQA